MEKEVKTATTITIRIEVLPKIIHYTDNLFSKLNAACFKQKAIYHHSMVFILTVT